MVPKEGRREILSLLLDEEPWREIHTSIFGRQPKFASQEQFLTQEPARVKLYITRKLTNRAYTSFELRKLLKEKLVPSSVIDCVLPEFQYYVDDAAWLENFITSQLHKKSGPKAISMKLKVKGIPEHAYTELLRQLAAPENQQEQIMTLLATRYKKLDLSQYKDKQKAVGALMRRGFDFEVIKETLDF